MIVMFLAYHDEQAMAALPREALDELAEQRGRYHRKYLASRAEPLAETFTAFYLVDCRDMEEAIELVKAYPMPEGRGFIEVRPAIQTWDYAPSLDIPVPPERIWRWYADLASWPQWKDGVAAVELDRPLQAGASGLLTPTDQPPMPFRIVSATENEGYVSETELAPDVVLRLEHILTPLPGNATRVIHRATIPRGALDVFGFSFSPDFNAGIRATLKSLAAIAQGSRDRLKSGS